MPSLFEHLVHHHHQFRRPSHWLKQYLLIARSLQRFFFGILVANLRVLRVSPSKSIYPSSMVSTEICANNSWDSVSISSFMIYISPTSNSHFLKHCLMVSVDTIFLAVWSQVIAFNTWTSSIIWETSSIRLTTSEQASFCYLWIKFLMMTALRSCSHDVAILGRMTSLMSVKLACKVSGWQVALS